MAKKSKKKKSVKGKSPKKPRKKAGLLTKVKGLLGL
jgi:hypothetical protein